MYAIRSYYGSGGSISPSGVVTVNHGANQTFNITSNIGMNIDDVLVDNASQGAISSYTFPNVTEDHSIAASFKVLYPQHWFISATAGVGGSIDPVITSYSIHYTKLYDSLRLTLGLWRQHYSR